MILTCDIGNSNIAFGLFDENNTEPVIFERIHTDKRKTDMEYAVDLNTVFEFHHVEKCSVTGAVISSVVSPLTHSLKAAVRSVLGLEAMEITHQLDLGFSLEMDHPEILGTDILCDIAGALTQMKPPIINLDMGTATVVSVINERGNFSGAFICPGVRTSLNSLVDRSASLPSVSFDAPEHAIGKNTSDSMKSGIIYGSAGLVDGILEQIESTHPANYSYMATGGMSRYILPHTNHTFTHDPTLILKGMLSIYKRNK